MPQLDKHKPEEKRPRHPAKFIEKKKAIVRIRDERTMEICQHQGFIYRLNPKDESTMSLYGGHQVIVLDKEIQDFENYTIVAMIELW